MFCQYIPSFPPTTVIYTFPADHAGGVTRTMLSLRVISLFLLSLCIVQAAPAAKTPAEISAARIGTKVSFADPRAALYAVGPHIPGINVDSPPSYAGLMPVAPDFNLSKYNLKQLRYGNYENGTRALFFWLWLADDKAPNFRDLVIWLSGGPGCSSLAYGMFEETGPIELRDKDKGPRLRRLTSWTSRANVLYVEQPIPTGFSTGKPVSADDFAASSEFYHFLNNLFQVFPEVIVDDDQSLYLVGESYGGVYVPYRASQLLSSVETWGLKGILLINGLLGDYTATSSLVTWDFVKANNDKYLHIPAANLTAIKNASDTCHLTDYYIKNVRFPQTTHMLPFGKDDKCEVWDIYTSAAQAVNPEFNIYDIRWQDHEHGFADNTYFGDPNQAGDGNPLNRTDVRDYIHAPVDKPFYPCSPDYVYPAGNSNLNPANSILPYVVEKLERTIVATAQYDSIIISNGTFLVLQNMTWAGQLGFHDDGHDRPFLNAEGKKAGSYTERDNLAFVRVTESGHMVRGWCRRSEPSPS